MLKRVAIFGGSASGSHDNFLKDAKQLGSLFGENKINLVYGGSNKGLMGATARAAKENGSNVVAIIPQCLFNLIGPHGFDRDIQPTITATIHLRKDAMYALADAAIVLPGGCGTMEETWEFITWSQLGLHGRVKPICALNTNGYFDPFISFLDHMVENGFMDRRTRQILQLAQSPAEAIEKACGIALPATI